MGLMDLVVWNNTSNVIDGSEKQMELNWWNGKGGIDGINETHGIDGMETRKEC